MGFKRMKTNLTFTDRSRYSSIEENKAIIKWPRIDNPPMKNYPAGRSAESDEAWPPQIIMKCLLLLQWFKIDSDPESEPRVNEKIFFGVRFFKDAMRMIKHELLFQFAPRDVIINEGIFHLYNNAFRVRFTMPIRNVINALFRKIAFNLLRGTRVVTPA